MPVVTVTRDFRHLAPNHLQVSEAAASVLVQLESCARDSCTARIAFARLGIAEIDKPILFEFRVQHDIAQTALPAIRDLRHAFDLFYRAVDRIELERTSLLGHEQATVRQKGHCPRLLEL